jgi:hypothetical protein
MNVKYSNAKIILNMCDNLIVQMLHFKTMKHHGEGERSWQFLRAKM